MAEHEAEQVCERTKAALAAAKRRGVKLGSARPEHWDGRESKRLGKARRAAAEARGRAFAEEYADLFPIIEEFHAAGHSLQAIADELNHRGHTTRRGRPWNRMQDGRLLRKIDDLQPKPMETT